MNQRRRTPRIAFVAAAELCDKKWRRQLTAQIRELSAYGCYVGTLNTLPVDNTVLLKIFDRSECFEAMAKVIYNPPKPWDGVNFPRIVIAERQSIASMASGIVAGRVELLRRGSQYGARSFFKILNSLRSASSICDDFRDPLATLLTNEGLTFNLLAILAYTPAKADMIFPGVRPPVTG